MDYNFTTSDLLVIVLALVFVVYIIAQTIIRWKETGSITESFKYAFDALGNAPIVQRGAETVFSRLDDKGRNAVANLLNTLDPFTDFVPGDWDQNTIDYFRDLLAKAPGSSALPSGNSSYVDELERLKNAPLIPKDIDEDQTQQLLNVPVNQNPTLKVSMVGYKDWGDEGKRAKDVPDGYSLGWQPFRADDQYAPPPEIHGMANGLQAELAHRRGRLILNQNVYDVLRPGQRYLLKVKVACDLKLKADAQIAGAIAVKAQICNGDAILKNLPAWSPESVLDLDKSFEALWVIGTGVAYGKLNYSVLVEVGNADSVPFADDSRIVIESVELMPVSSEYGGTRVVTF